CLFAAVKDPAGIVSARVMVTFGSPMLPSASHEMTGLNACAAEAHVSSVANDAKIHLRVVSAPALLGDDRVCVACGRPGHDVGNANLRFIAFLRLITKCPPNVQRTRANELVLAAAAGVPYAG